MKNILSVASSPHIRHHDTTRSIMFDVILALLPAAVNGCILFGAHALILLTVTVASCVLFEYLWNLILKKPQSIGDLSAVVTGLLLGLNLPPKTPVWIAVIGSFTAIIAVKQMFGGIGHNFANPAITARIVLLVSFPSVMTTFAEPLTGAVSSATPLASNGAGYTLKILFFGSHSGCIGETSAFLLLIGALLLFVRRVITPVIPLSFIGTVAVLTALSGGDVLKQIFTGGLIIGAVFMATDYTTSPTSNWGKLLFGVGCGLITFIIRHFGNLPEGVSYSILIMNILVPYINRLTTVKPFGAKEAAENE